MSTLLSKNELGMKIFLCAYANDPVKMTGAEWTKQQIRAYRQQVLDECANQRETNPMGSIIRQGISGISLSELGEVLTNMKALYDRYEAEYQEAAS